MTALHQARRPARIHLRPRRVAALLASALAACALVAGPVAPASAASGEPYGGVYTLPMVGNSGYLVYLHSTGTCKHPEAVLEVRNVSGTTQTLTVPATFEKYLAQQFSCADGTGVLPPSFSLSATTLSIDADSSVLWWDLKTHRHGAGDLPASYPNHDWVGSIPGGWLYELRTSATPVSATTLIRQGTGGKVTKYGTYASFQQVVTGTNGLLLVRSSSAAAPNAPHAVRYLKYGTTTATKLAAPPAGDDFTCTAVVQTFAACFTGSEDEDGFASEFTQGILPLDGSATQSCVLCYGLLPADSSFTTASLRGVAGVVLRRNASAQLRLLRPDGTTLTGAGHGVSEDVQSVVTAYGKLIVLHSNSKITEQTTPATKQYTLVDAH